MSATERRVRKLEKILDVARAMSEERDSDRLLALIVHSATLVAESERSTLFLLDAERNELWSKVAEGSGEIRFPADRGLAGAALSGGVVINIPDAYEDPRFNRDFDRKSGFRTRAVLTVPMFDRQGEKVGVLQTLNKVDGGLFDSEDVDVVQALAGVAASALVNIQHHEEVARLFEGFASAAVVAIESRDPTTAGHSGRVASMSTALAEAVNRAGEGALAPVQLSRGALEELRYAALLHDFGKVGVREAVLVKADKLYPWDMSLLEERFESARRALELSSARRQVALLRGGCSDCDTATQTEQLRLAAELAELEGLLEFVRRINRPNGPRDPAAAAEVERRLEMLGSLRYDHSSGESRALVTPRERELLAIPQGTLSADERREIESHVTHTYRFLSQIPWTRGLRRVPELAFGHHEKLSGRGYPRAVGGEALPVETRIITVCDIYDALTASDRPYKTAMPHEKALAILEAEVRSGAVDGDLLATFVAADVGAVVRRQQRAAS